MNIDFFSSTVSNKQSIQLITSFCFGVLLAPFSWGFFFFLLFLILYELGFYQFCIQTNFLEYDPLIVRLGIVAASIYGWIIGRYLVGYIDPMNHWKKIQMKKN
jgi:hypothetical protein